MFPTLRRAYGNVVVSSRQSSFREQSWLFARGLSTTDESTEEAPTQAEGVPTSTTCDSYA